MKYILELLDTNGQPTVCNSRGDAVSRLDAYPYHRPGQPIAVVYLNEGKRKALLAIGHDSGVGLYGTTRRYTIIGDCDATSSVSSIVSANNILLSYIPYSNLLDEMEELYGEHRFGYLGTDDDPWKDLEYIPNGTTVQAAFEAILCGNRQHGGGDDQITLTMLAQPQGGSPSQNATITLSENESTATYTIFATATTAGTISNTTSGVIGGGPAIPASDFLSKMTDYKEGSWQFEVGVNKGETKTFTYSATVTDTNGNAASSSCTITITREGSDEPTGTVYKIYYHHVIDSSNDTYLEYSTSSIYPSSPSSLGWTAPEGYEFGGWSYTQNGEPIPSGQQVDSGRFAEESEGVMKLDLYAVWNTVTPAKKTLVLRLPEQSIPYNGQSHAYDFNQMTVTDSDNNSVPSSAYSIVWTPSEADVRAAVTGTDADTYLCANCIQAVAVDTEHYEDSALGSPKLVINKLTAHIYATLDGAKNTLAKQETEAKPEEDVDAENFINSDDSFVSANDLAWQNGNIPSDPLTPGTYKLTWAGTVPSNISKNYNVNIHPITLTVAEKPLEIKFNTSTASGASPVDHNAQKVAAGDTINIDTYTGMTLPGSTTGIEGWWVCFCNNTNVGTSTSIIKSNKNVTITGIKKWDGAQWASVGSNLITPASGNTFEYAAHNTYGNIVKEKCYIAISVQ